MAEIAAHGVEEHQVARLKFFFVDDLGRSCLLVCPAGQYQPYGLVKHGANKAAAVKTGFCTVAPAFVRHTQKTHCVTDQVCRTVCDDIGFVGHFVTDIFKTGDQASVCQQFVKIAGVGGFRRGVHSQGTGGEGKGNKPTNHGGGGYHASQRYQSVNNALTKGGDVTKCALDAMKGLQREATEAFAGLAPCTVHPVYLPYEMLPTGLRQSKPLPKPDRPERYPHAA